MQAGLPPRAPQTTTACHSDQNSTLKVSPLQFQCRGNHLGSDHTHCLKSQIIKKKTYLVTLAQSVTPSPPAFAIKKFLTQWVNLFLQATVLCLNSSPQGIAYLFFALAHKSVHTHSNSVLNFCKKKCCLLFKTYFEIDWALRETPSPFKTTWRGRTRSGWGLGAIQKKCSVKLVVRTSERATPLSLEQQQEKDSGGG